MKVISRGMDVNSAPFCDVSLMGMQWKNEGKDFHMYLEMHSSYKEYPKQITVVCEWATNLKIDLDWGAKHIGSLLSWGFNLEKNQKDVYQLLFDFGGSPGGSISLECNEISVQA
jgi:hypothetical protein